MTSVALIIRSVIRKTIYRLCFLYIGIRSVGTKMKKAADTDICMYLEILHQTMFTNAFSYTTMLLLLLQCTVSCCCSNTAAINNLNWSFTIKFLVKIATK